MLSAVGKTRINENRLRFLHFYFQILKELKDYKFEIYNFATFKKYWQKKCLKYTFVFIFTFSIYFVYLFYAWFPLQIMLPY